MINILIPKIISKNQLANALKEIPGFPPYISPNWDSIEECLADFISENDGDVTILHDDFQGDIETSIPTYLDILRSLRGEFGNLRVRFKE
jgi:hypothetical protein